MALLYQRYCSGTAQGPAADVDVSREYGRQREYLERTVEGLKSKLAKDSSGAHVEQLRLMSDNCALLREVNELRREVKALRAAGGGGGAQTTRWGGGIGGMVCTCLEVRSTHHRLDAVSPARLLTCCTEPQALKNALSSDARTNTAASSSVLCRPSPANRKPPGNTLTASSSKSSSIGLPRQQSNARPGQLSAGGAAAAAAAALLAATPTSQVASPSAAAAVEEQLVEGLRREVEMQRELIAQLRRVVAEQQGEQQQGGQQQGVDGGADNDDAALVRPMSRERLAPIGVQ